MNVTLNELIKNHFMKHLILYMIIILSFTVGISTGAFTVNVLNSSQIDGLSEYMQEFFYIINLETLNHGDLLKFSIFNNFKAIIILWVLGMTIIGIPFILIIVGIKGFVIGFTVGFLIKYLSFKGVLFSILGILPQNLIIIPCYIILGVICMEFSLSMIKSRTKVKYKKEDFRVQFISYCIIVALIFFITILGSLIEAYFTPVFIKTITASII